MKYRSVDYWKRLWWWEGLGEGGEGMTEDEMAGWHDRLDGHDFEWTLGVGDGQGGLACCDSWGRKELDTTEQLIWSDLIWWAKVHGVAKSRTRLSDWTELNWMGLDAMIFILRMLNFKPAFSLYSLTFIKRLFSSSLLSAMRVVSLAYLGLLIFLLAILTPLVLHPA